MKKIVYSIILSSVLFGCYSEINEHINPDPVFSYTGTVKEDPFHKSSDLMSICGNKVSLKIDGSSPSSFNTIGKKYFVQFDCENGYELKDTGSYFFFYSPYKLKDGVEFFVNIDYKNSTYEIHSYDTDFGYYINENEPLDKNINDLVVPLYEHFNYFLINSHKELERKEQESINNKRKLEKIKANV